MDGTNRGRVVALAAGLWCAVLLSCGSDKATDPDTLGVIEIKAGTEQEGREGEVLSGNIQVELLTRAGAPAAGVRVQWTPQDGGTADPPASVTDVQGRATTRWTLGNEEVEHTLEASAPGFPTQYVRAKGRAQLMPLDSVIPLQLETYEGSGQTVHPDFLERTDGGDGREYLALTPYPGGNSAYENPVLYESHQRLQWSVPVPSQNPIVAPTAGYFSDPDVVYDPDVQEMRLYFRQVDQENQIYLMRSANGSVWSAPELVVHAPNDEVVSPSIVRRSATDWLMWSVNGGSGCGGDFTAVELRRSTDGVHWSAPEPVSLTQSGYTPWHIDVQWIPSRGEYWAVYNGKTPGSCSTPALFFATSKDGVTWTTYPTPLLARGEAKPFKDIVYRSTFAFEPKSGIVTFWYSGATYSGHGYVWSTAIQRKRLGAIFEKVRKDQRGGSLRLRSGVPGLVVAP